MWHVGRWVNPQTPGCCYKLIKLHFRKPLNKWKVKTPVCNFLSVKVQPDRTGAEELTPDQSWLFIHHRRFYSDTTTTGSSRETCRVGADWESAASLTERVNRRKKEPGSEVTTQVWVFNWLQYSEDGKRKSHPHFKSSDPLKSSENIHRWFSPPSEVGPVRLSSRAVSDSVWKHCSTAGVLNWSSDLWMTGDLLIHVLPSSALDESRWISPAHAELNVLHWISFTLDFIGSILYWIISILDHFCFGSALHWMSSIMDHFCTRSVLYWINSLLLYF